MKCRVCSVKCEVWSEVPSVKSEMCGARGVWSYSVKCGV